jgi:hypothetical protein
MNHDDGRRAALGRAPIHFAFRLAKWRDLLKTTWDELNRGDYDWAHLAMHLRLAEVLEKCKSDRSLAIAHGREDLYEAKDEKKRGKKADGSAPAKGKKKAPAGTMTQTTMPSVDRKGDA